MKTIYNVKALCVVALLGSAAAASAQEDVTKEKNLNREMTLEREYDPSVQGKYASRGERAGGS